MLLQPALNIFNICIFRSNGYQTFVTYVTTYIYGYMDAKAVRGSMYQRCIGCTDQWPAMATD